ncbi:MAG: hypothetical protein KDC87_14435 [Planctomycetes bacterium]|nr:hypothetical protein [Planctomycetota bacterium]
MTTLFRLLRASAACAVLCVPFGSCAAITGLGTGAVTGLVDFPSTVIAREFTDDDPADQSSFWAATFVLWPVGVVVGPVLGFCKGLALDVNTLSGRTTSSEVFGSYGKASVWRPFEWSWLDAKRGYSR